VSVKTLDYDYDYSIFTGKPDNLLGRDRKATQALFEIIKNQQGYL